MANRNRGRGGRSRKRRPAAARVAGEDPTNTEAGQTSPSGERAADGDDGRKRKSSSAAQTAKRTRPRGATERSGGAWRDSRSGGERPEAPWHPLPLSELLILVGAISAVFGLLRLQHGGISHGGPALFAGIAAVLIGTVEVMLREHLSGYRSHTLILTLLPLIVFHTAVILIVASLTEVPRALNLGLLLVDVALGTVLFKLLRARYVDARRERRFAGGR